MKNDSGRYLLWDVQRAVACKASDVLRDLTRKSGQPFTIPLEIAERCVGSWEDEHSRLRLTSSRTAVEFRGLELEPSNWVVLYADTGRCEIVVDSHFQQAFRRDVTDAERVIEICRETNPGLDGITVKFVHARSWARRRDRAKRERPSTTVTIVVSAKGFFPGCGHSHRRTLRATGRDQQRALANVRRALAERRWKQRGSML